MPLDPRAQEVAVSGVPINVCPPCGCQSRLPQPGFSGPSAHLLCFVYKMVRLVPVGEEVYGLLIMGLGCYGT